MRKLVWLTVNCSYSHSSLALPLLHAAAGDVSGWQWERREVTLLEDSGRIAADISASECDLLCATLYLFNRDKTLDILKRVHALEPQICIAVGGPECPVCDAPSMLQTYPFIDQVCSGEGEEYFADFLRNFETAHTRRQILAGKSPVYEQWTSAPLPVSDPFFRTDRPFVQIETSRGCPMSCAYCTSAGIKQRYRDLDSVRQELELLHEKGVREIRVLDRTFNLPQSRGAALLQLFRQYPDMKFHIEVHPQFLDDELRKGLHQALPGQLHIEAGIQSLDPTVQTSIGRRSDIDRVLDGLKFLTGCSAFGTHTDLLAGLPAQTLQSLKLDILQLMQIHPEEIQLEVLKILPGTPIKQKLDKYGIVFSPDPPYDVMRTRTMSVDDILEARFLSRLLDLFYNHEHLHTVLLTVTAEQPDWFLEFADSLRLIDPGTLLNLKKRFLILEEFLRDRQLPDAREELALQWLLAGYPAGEGPDHCSSIAPQVPQDAVLYSGCGAAVSHRESRFRVMTVHHKMYYFCWNRSFQFNKPCAVWKKTE